MDYLSCVRFSIESFYFLIRGKGKMTGEQFADHIKKVYDADHNSQTKQAVELAERFIKDIEVSVSGTIRWTFAEMTEPTDIDGGDEVRLTYGEY